jgi:acyl-CoA reductase-like NAD-dependent aldehyde dehydrogenase
VDASDDLALIMTLEQGKLLAEAKAEVAYGASFLEGGIDNNSSSTAYICKDYKDIT